MSQVDDLNAAISQLSVDFSELVARVEAKLAAAPAPAPAPDLSAEIAALHSFSAALDGFAADPAVETPANPAEPVPAPPVDAPVDFEGNPVDVPAAPVDAPIETPAEPVVPAPADPVEAPVQDDPLV